MDWATTLQTSMWAHTWASSSALPLRLAFILGFQQFRQNNSHLRFQVPSYFLGWWVMDKWGRRWILFETMMIGIYLCMWTHDKIANTLSIFKLLMIFERMMIGIYPCMGLHDKIAYTLLIFNLITNLQVDFPASPVSLFLLGPLLGEICVNILSFKPSLSMMLSEGCFTHIQRWTVGLAMIGKFQIACR